MGVTESLKSWLKKADPGGYLDKLSARSRTVFNSISHLLWLCLAHFPKSPPFPSLADLTSSSSS